MWTALDWLLPPRCAGCGCPGARWCQDCAAKSRRVGGGCCVLCGKRHPTGAGQCPRVKAIDQAVAWGYHQDPLRKAILRLKYKRDIALGDALAVHLRDLVNDFDGPVDLVVPVPLAPSRKRARGYNQAALLAYPLALRLDLPYNRQALRRVRETASQVGLSLDQRRENVSGAFQARMEAVAGRRILLVDDVLTTGSTLDAAAQALRQAGASQVFGLVVSRALPAHE